MRQAEKKYVVKNHKGEVIDRFATREKAEAYCRKCNRDLAAHKGGALGRCTVECVK